MTYTVAIIGCGRPWQSEGATGFGMSHAHANGYKATGKCQLVALADINEENARAFQQRHGGDQIFSDYRRMLADVQPEIVSICTWPGLHAEMVVAAAEAGVKAIHCEKPMAPTYGESRRMLAACEANGTQLTFNHQRRFGRAWRHVKELLVGGAIGKLERIEGHCPDLFDWGTHWFDMFNFYNDETPVEWLIGQIDLRGAHRVFGVVLEGQGLAHFRYANGVTATLTTGPIEPWQATNRLYGSDGMIELVIGEGQGVRYWGTDTNGWQQVTNAFEEGGDIDDPVSLGVRDLVEALEVGREPQLSGRRALRATELIFATYESARRRARIDLPLEIDDSPLQWLLAQQ